MTLININIKSNGGNKDIPVTLSVSNPNSPQLTLSPTTLDFESGLTNLSFLIRNTGTGTVNYELSSAQKWISINSIKDSVSNNTKEIRVTIERQGLSIGNYNGEIVVTSNVGIQQILVKMSVLATPAISVVPASLEFDSIQTSRSFNIANVGGGTLNWVANKNQNWLNLSITSGLNSGLVAVTVDRTGLAGGTYSDNILVQSNGGNVNLPVTIKVPYPPSPVLKISTTNLNFDSTKNQLSFTITNNGVGSLNWNVSSTSNWISVTPKSGTNQGTIVVSVDRNLLNGGNFNGVISITSNGGNAQINVLVVAAPTIPNLFLNANSFDCGEKDQRKFIISNTGTGVLNYQISSNQSWLTISPSSGSTKDTTTITVSVDVSNYLYGDYKGELSITSNGGSGKIQIVASKVGSFTETILQTGDVATTPNSICVLSSNNVWAVGYKILRWTGNVWIEVQKPSSEQLTAVSFSSTNNGWAVGNNSTILKYDGISWKSISDSIIEKGISFVDVVALSDSNVIISGSGYPVSYRFDGKKWEKIINN